ncbi:hypothetical protein [Halorubrum sp. DTA46]|uniref:hypothetical protein n=1 Tax=Halorubrum sp. DTA46 TaxID=3402162 RepID=UPI003AAD80B9
MQRPLSPEQREAYRGLNGGPVPAPRRQSPRAIVAVAALHALLVAAAFPVAAAVALAVVVFVGAALR